MENMQVTYVNKNYFNQNGRLKQFRVNKRKFFAQDTIRRKVISDTFLHSNPNESTDRIVTQSRNTISCYLDFLRNPPNPIIIYSAANPYNEYNDHYSFDKFDKIKNRWVNYDMIIDPMPPVVENRISSVDEAYRYASRLRELQWTGKLTPSPEDILEYSLNASSNEFISEHPTFADYLENKAKYLLSLIEKQKTDLQSAKPLKRDCIYWRGVAMSKNDTSSEHADKFIDIIKTCKVNDIISPDWAPMCAARDIDIAYCYANKENSCTLLKIKAPKGSKISGGSIEVRFPSKSEFRVLSKQKIKKIEIIELEYIPFE